MLRLMTLLCLAVAAFGTPLQDARRQNGRIVGAGDPITIEDAPYQLSLSVGGFFACGATIISPLWAVTAAQCAGGSVANMKLRAGSTRHDDIEDGIAYDVAQKIVHLSYNPTTNDYDIALLKVSKPFAIDDTTIAAVTLPASNYDFLLPALGTVTGWGATSAGGPWSPDLLSVDVNFLPADFCQTKYDTIATVTARMVCTLEPEGGKDACQGDSGGPLVHKDGKLVGIVSWGRGCALPDFPRVYTSVPALRNWILANTGV